ncbi:MAG TPA: VOC family protein [Cyclobacteriaceae bacterium]|nr:VOC family protein [Cyclobacteriaceae bacterium]
MHLYRIIFPVNDINEATNFYSNVFEQAGLRVSPGRHYFDLGGTILAIYDPIADGDVIKQPWTFHENQYIYIATDNLESVHKKFHNSNSKHVDKRVQLMPWGEKLFYANDPFGNPICFVDGKTIFKG